MNHQPVLLKECVDGLAIKADGIYIDGTFGRGGHSREILKHLGQKGRLIAIDKDLAAIAHAKNLFADDPRFMIVHGSFAEMADIAQQLGVAEKVNGILLDLGVSSPQIDDAERGFSFLQNGPLDMRMDQQQALTAEKFVNQASAEEMMKVFFEYGEERFARRIAKAIVEAREVAPIETTGQLAEVVKAANPKWERHKHPATRVFQAIRIHINRELEDLSHVLEHSLRTLGQQGRLVVISFHSLEDRMVKQFMRHAEQGDPLPKGVPIRMNEIKQNFKRIGKAIKPSVMELEHNLRARSAVLRIGEKIA